MTNASTCRNGTARVLPRVLRVAATALAIMVAFTACDSLFTATDPGAITESDLENASVMGALVNGVIGEFDAAHDEAVLTVGILSDELIASGSWPPWHNMDKLGIITLEDQPGNITEEMWDEWQSARFMADNTYERLQEYSSDPSSDERVAMVRLYAGMAYRGFADYFCAAAYDSGPRVERAASYDTAQSRLTDAINIAQAAGVDSIAEMAYLQRAYVRLFTGDLEGALSDAREVGNDLHWVAHFSDNPGESNDIWFPLNDRGEATVGPDYYHTGDPRIVLDSIGETGPDGNTMLWIQQKYPDQYTDIPIGKWEDARLIEAEILLERDNDVAGAVALMNQVRAAAGLGQLDPDMSASDARDALRQERAYEFFLEGKRFVDMRRYGMFPADWGATCIPISRTELDANPNL